MNRLLMMSLVLLPLHGGARLAGMEVVTSTMYTCSVDETDSSPMVTASGMRCGYPVLAVSQDLLPRYPFGTVVLVNGHRYVVGDTMHRRITRTIDLPARSKREARRHGRRPAIVEVVR